MKNFADYSQLMCEVLSSIDSSKIDEVHQLLKWTKRDLYLFGNGGSAAIANHWVCDFSKGGFEDTGRRSKATSLSSNMPLITAIANDIGYEYIFARQLEYMNPKYHDVAIAISSSGNSKNIVLGIMKARDLGMTTVAITGFTGGVAATLADISIHIPSSNYGIVEDISMMILHSLSQRLRLEYAKDPNKLKL